MTDRVNRYGKFAGDGLYGCCDPDCEGCEDCMAERAADSIAEQRDTPACSGPDVNGWCSTHGDDAHCDEICDRPTPRPKIRPCPDCGAIELICDCLDYCPDCGKDEANCECPHNFRCSW
jgi:hypothetical protein